MIRINKAQFKENISEFVDGVYIFESDSCGACSRYSTLLKSVKSTKKTKKIFIVDCAEDFSYYISLGIDEMPETRLFVAGQVVKSIKGVPKKKDIESLLNE